VVTVGQGAIKGSRRSNPATYTGLLEPIRKAFAKANGVKPALFSANSEGACPNCNGHGVIYTDLAMMAGVTRWCEVCEGKRFQATVLEYELGGRNIADVLAMPVAEAETFFADGDARTPAAHAVLRRLADVGLGYLSLGQPLTTLSGGERQRLKLATHMADKGGSTSWTSRPRLHLADVQHLLGLLDRLVDSGPPSSSSSTTRRSWRTPTGSSTSAPARATTGPDRLRGHARRPGLRPLHAHRRASGGLRRPLTGPHAGVGAG
jgi:excinuclease UvrABC ATPase subunit